MNLWPFIEVEEAGQHSVKRACELLEISRAAYYVQRKHIPSRRALDDAELTARIKEIHAGSKGTYGAPRIHAQLRREGSVLRQEAGGPAHGPRRPGRALPEALAQDHRWRPRRRAPGR